MIITRKIEFDMGHRIPNHESKCANPHGHRYTCIVHLEGALIDTIDDPQEGMVIDFAHVKTIAKGRIDTHLDHGFMVYKNDVMVDLLDGHGWKIIVVDMIPTAENIAKYIYTHLAPLFTKQYNESLVLKAIELRETPNVSVLYAE